ncbi:MAG: hypothetical protein DWQ10_06635 [Calditrichaeota bacterium]|nr:MAG: hypothetical protein DWQ10_06635 [Calditrichota bacterium]
MRFLMKRLINFLLVVVLLTLGGVSCDKSIKQKPLPTVDNFIGSSLNVALYVMQPVLLKSQKTWSDTEKRPDVSGDSTVTDPEVKMLKEAPEAEKEGDVDSEEKKLDVPTDVVPFDQPWCPPPHDGCLDIFAPIISIPDSIERGQIDYHWRPDSVSTMEISYFDFSAAPENITIGNISIGSDDYSPQLEAYIRVVRYLYGNYIDLKEIEEKQGYIASSSTTEYAHYLDADNKLLVTVEITFSSTNYSVRCSIEKISDEVEHSQKF